MESIAIEGTKITPSVKFGYDSGKIELSGRSIPEDAATFYKPLLDWLKSYSYSPKPLTEVHIKLEYFNTSSSKCLLDILKIIEMIHRAGNEVKIFWYYEGNDEDMHEVGQDYESMINMTFNMIEYDDSGY
ncbi:MAG: DUF1987 domain-containing protein [Bacteroidia bacterium]|nr:DUF1987 domain-containing protein [Bacteroidia bacterium]